MAKQIKNGSFGSAAGQGIDSPDYDSMSRVVEEGAHRQVLALEIKRLRTVKGIRQEDLAAGLTAMDGIEVKPALVGHWESARTPITTFTLTRIARFFGVHPGTIIEPSTELAADAEQASIVAAVKNLSPEKFVATSSVLSFSLSREQKTILRSLLDAALSTNSEI